MIILLKFFFKLFLKFCIFLVIFCVAFDYFFLSDKKIDVSNETNFKKWTGATFEFNQDAFLYKRHEDRMFSLGVARGERWLPESTEDYLNDLKRGESLPNNIWHQESFRAIYLLPSGTQFKITGIFEIVRPAVGRYLTVEVIVLNGPYKGYRAQAQYLFNYDISPYELIGPKESIHQIP